jgi:hypothetical protein
MRLAVEDVIPSALTDFLRYHVLIHVFQGDIRAWMHLLQRSDRDDNADARFLRWLGNRISAEPALLDRIRVSVEASGVWPPEE